MHNQEERESDKMAGEMMCIPVALPGTVLKITETVVVVGVSLRIVKLTTPPSLTVYIVGSNSTITTADEIGDIIVLPMKLT